jgi:hypothetical protein
MRIIEVKNMVRKEFPIYYRRFYSGTTVIELVNKPIEFPIDFQIEHKPTGQTEISLKFGEKVDYPLVPLQRELKKFINDLDSSGKLPN